MGGYSGRTEDTAGVWAVPLHSDASRKLCTGCRVSRTRDVGRCG
jgi:hypothetical protein